MKLSIIITNYNYDLFLGDAIESALKTKWENKEILVIDDGSTDNSKHIISKYNLGLRPFFKRNEGQFSAYNIGLEKAVGEWIIFLDSDDLLDENLARYVYPLCRPDVSRIQFQMACINKNGVPTNKNVPSFPSNVSPRKISYWNQETGSYPSSWGSASVYSSAFLKKIFPLNSEFKKTGDSQLIAIAPFFGKVETIKRPLAFYRIHDKNSFTKNIFSFHYKKEIFLLRSKRINYKYNFANNNNLFFNKNCYKNNLSFLYDLFILSKIDPLAGTYCKQFTFSLKDLTRSLFISQPLTKKQFFGYIAIFILAFISPVFIIKNFPKIFFR